MRGLARQTRVFSFLGAINYSALAVIFTLQYIAGKEPEYLACLLVRRWYSRPPWADREAEVLMMVSDCEYKRGPPVSGPGSSWWMMELTFRSLMSCASKKRKILNRAWIRLMALTWHCEPEYTNKHFVINKQIRWHFNIGLRQRQPQALNRCIEFKRPQISYITGNVTRYAIQNAFTFEGDVMVL